MHDPFRKALTDRSFVQTVKGSTFNIVLYIRSVELTKGKHIRKKRTHPFVREDVTEEPWPYGLIFTEKDVFMSIRIFDTRQIDRL
jgi:hypothetical protein